MLYQIIIVVHILLGIGVIGLVLMQQGRGADAGAAFGSGGSGSVFGAQGSASFLSRTTAIFASLFFVTSLGLAFLSGYQSKKSDVVLDAPVVEKQNADVPLTQIGGNNAAPAVAAPAPVAEVPVAELPEAPAIKEVEPATPTTPAQ